MKQLSSAGRATRYWNHPCKIWHGLDHSPSRLMAWKIAGKALCWTLQLGRNCETLHFQEKGLIWTTFKLELLVSRLRRLLLAKGSIATRVALNRRRLNGVGDENSWRVLGISWPHFWWAMTSSRESLLILRQNLDWIMTKQALLSEPSTNAHI